MQLLAIVSFFFCCCSLCIFFVFNYLLDDKRLLGYLLVAGCWHQLYKFKKKHFVYFIVQLAMCKFLFCIISFLLSRAFVNFFLFSGFLSSNRNTKKGTSKWNERLYVSVYERFVYNFSFALRWKRWKKCVISTYVKIVKLHFISLFKSCCYPSLTFWLCVHFFMCFYISSVVLRAVFASPLFSFFCLLAYTICVSVSFFSFLQWFFSLQLLEELRKSTGELRNSNRQMFRFTWLFLLLFFVHSLQFFLCIL